MKFASQNIRSGQKKLSAIIIASVFCFQNSSCRKKPESKQTDTFEFTKNVLTKEITKLMEETGIPSVSIALIKEDSIVWANAFGYANVKTKTLATTSTTYSTGSTVKPFMSMAIMQLVEKGLVDLDKPVNGYLKNPIPSFSENSKPITLRHLLSHQSGLPTEGIFLDLWGSGHRKTLEEITSSLKPVREPEEKYMYCNNGFVVAALVIENLTGKTYGEYVNQNILKRLNLENIDFLKPTAETVEEIALPYKIVYNKSLPIGQLYSEPYPAGGLTYMSPSQMSRFLIAHLNNGLYSGNRLLSSELIGQFHETSFGDEYYGLGIGIDRKNGMTYLFHNGLQPGYSAVFILNLYLKTGVYLVASAASEQQMNTLADLATELMEGKKDFTPIPSFATKEFKEIEITESEAKKFIGTYKIEGTELNLTILKKLDKLYLKNPSNVEYEIMPYEKNKFYLKTEDEQIEFIKGENVINGLILRSKGQEMNAKRIE